MAENLRWWMLPEVLTGISELNDHSIALFHVKAQFFQSSEYYGLGHETTFTCE